MITLHAALALAHPSQVTFTGVVTTPPHFFYGTHTHAIHEAFDVRTPGGDGVEIVDNVALAPRVPLHVGDRIAVAGELVPGATPHPIVHWTHHDPAGRHPGGYIDFAGRRYA